MKISVNIDEVAKICAQCMIIKNAMVDPNAHCEQCALWHICDGQGIETFVDEIVNPGR